MNSIALAALIATLTVAGMAGQAMAVGFHGGFHHFGGGFNHFGGFHHFGGFYHHNLSIFCLYHPYSPICQIE